jgi:ABC-type uncharacterized transport system auxiliary subunit
MSLQEGNAYSIVNITSNGQTPVRIDPNYNTRMPRDHITVYSHVGWTTPGTNLLQITTVEERKNSLRVVGVYLCGVCAETGDMGNGALNHAAIKPPI